MNREFERLERMIVAKKQELSAITKQKQAMIKPLVKRRDEIAQQLYKYMIENDLESFNGISIEQVAPKEKTVKNKMTRDQQIIILGKMGIRNPQAALEEIGL